MAVILICALNPDERLVQLVTALSPRDIVVVDDGSEPDHAPLFERVRDLGATVLHHDRNRGKGAALRTGIAFVRREFPGEAVVTVDSDGQHRPQDVAVVEAGLDDTAADTAIVLGERAFTGTVPFRSRFGNAVSRGLFALASGVRVGDTQTGLRGLPAATLGWAGEVRGDRFEYEQRVLLQAARRGVPLSSVPIATLYLEGNASSHFQPVADSVRVLRPLLAPIARFATLGIVCAVIDAVLVIGLTAALGAVGAAAIIARAASASLHFFGGRRWVFPSPGSLGEHARRYAILAGSVVAVGAVALELAVAAGAALLPAKLAIDGALVVVTYLAQRFGVFAAARTPKRAIAPRGTDRPTSTRLETP